MFATSASATTFTVEAASGDAPDLDLNDGICDAAAGAPVTCTIRAAVQTANSPAVPSADVIEIPAGSYSFALGGNDDTAALGDLDITTNLEIRGLGGGATINALSIDRIFHIPSGLPTVKLSNLTLNGGVAAGSSNGGAIKAESGTLTIDRTTISGNQAAGNGSKGGGVYAVGPSLVSLTDSSVASNHAALGAVLGGEGGGIYTESPLNLERVSVNSNHAAQGCTQIVCSGYGGGLEAKANATLTNVTVHGNAAEGNATANGSAGGGISQFGAMLTIVNSTIAGNVSTGAGGFGGGNIMTTGGSIVLRNTIVANGSSGQTSFPTQNCSFDGGTYTTQGNNLEARAGQGASECGLSPGVNGDITATDPGFGTFGLHGGPTQTLALLPTSPAVDAGGPTGPATDQRGVSRPQGARCDIGAYELDSTPMPGVTCAGPPAVIAPATTPGAPASQAARKKCKRKKKARAARKKCNKRKKRN